MSAFQGLQAVLFEIFADLVQDISKDFRDANRQRWHQDVKAPKSALIDELFTEFVSLCMFRPNRDLRFVRDEAPSNSGTTAEPPKYGFVSLL